MVPRSRTEITYVRSGKWLNTDKEETRIPNTFQEFGVMLQERQGIRAEVADIYNAIKEGLSDTEIMDMYPNEAYNVDRFERIRQRIKAEENSNLRRDVEVFYIWGKTRRTERQDLLWINTDMKVFTV